MPAGSSGQGRSVQGAPSRAERGGVRHRRPPAVSSRAAPTPMSHDLSPPWMFVKVALFAVIALLAGGCLLWQNPTWTTAACVLALTWAACRAYYFLFHVLQHWIDPTFRFTGLIDLLRHLAVRRRNNPSAK